MMNLIILTSLILPLLAPAVTAATQKCSTDYGSTRINGPVPTTTITQTAPPTTETLHVAKRGGGTVTVIATSTIRKFAPTVVVTSTFTSTLTSTDTTTTTSYTTEPTTVAAPSGWSPIQDTLNTNSLRRRNIGHPHGPRVVEKRGLPGLNAAAAFPTAVRCTATVPNPNQITDIVSQGPVTTTGRTTVTVSNGFHTNTFNSLVYVTTTTTMTSTSTSIIYSPTTYAACNGQNAFGPNFQNGGFGYYFTNVLNNGPGASDNSYTMPNGATSAMECCQACFAYGRCETFMFRQENQNCVLLTHAGESCSSQTQHPNIMLSRLGSDTGAGYVVGNGPCGYAYSGNSDGTVFPVQG